MADKQKELPDLHRKAQFLKNRKRLQRDGGRAWIKDSQLHEARKEGNLHMETIGDKKKKSLLEDTRDPNPDL